jgi:hypothetical protein
MIFKKIVFANLSSSNPLPGNGAERIASHHRPISMVCEKIFVRSQATGHKKPFFPLIE